MRWIIVVLAVLAVAAGVIGHWLGLRTGEARREELDRREMGTPSPEDRVHIMAADTLSNYLDKIQAQVRAHEGDFERLNKQNALTWNIHRREDIERDRRMIRQFLASNTKLTDSLQYGADFIRADMNTAKLPADVRDSVLALYAKSQTPLLPLQMHVRQCDQEIGESALAVLDLLDFNWGAWTRDEATGRVDFNNSVTLATFQDYVTKLKAAADERQEAQRTLAHDQERN